MGDGVECLRDVHPEGYGSARGLALVEARHHPSRDGEQGRGGGMPQFEAVLGGTSAQRLHDGREDEPLQDLHCRAEQKDRAVRAPCSRGYPAFRIGIMTELFQIAGMLIPATERLKSSVRKAKPCGPRWLR